MANLTESFNKLKPKQKAVLVIMGVGVLLSVVGCMSYFTNSVKSKPKAAVKDTKNVPVSMDNGLLGKNQLLEAQKDAQNAKDALADYKKQEAAAALFGQSPGTPVPPQPQPAGPAVNAMLPPAPVAAAQTKTQPAKLPPPQNVKAAAVAPPPPPPLPAPSTPSKSPAPLPPPAAAQQAADVEIGGIAMVSGGSGKDKDGRAEDKKKDERRSVYLPISYMEATLLSGLDAPTSTEAKGNPVPVLIRVKTPAVLPNDVKANLRGCFVVADGKGNLGTERAELVLVTLSCLDRKGQAVVDQPVTGYVVDTDGKAGLRGHVVTKMGAMITRTMISGLFGGLGDAIASANTTNSISALGSLQTVKPEDIGMVAAGKGLSNAFKEIQKFYLDLAHQTLPVIEIGAARPVTLVLTKGTQLEIKKIRKGDRL